MWQAAAAQAAGGILGGVLGHESAKKLQRWEHGNNQALMQQQFNNNVDMWNMQNAYNNPSAQMQRMRDAGLNPALMYGKNATGSTSGNAGAIAPVKPLQTQGRNATMSGMNAAMQAMHAFADLKLKKVQASNVESQTEKNNEEIVLIKTREIAQGLENSLFKYRKEGLISDNTLKAFTNSLNDITKMDQADYLKHKAEHMRWQSGLTEGEISRRNEKHAQDMLKAGQEILNLKQQRKNMQIQNVHERAKMRNTVLQGKGFKLDNVYKDLTNEWFEWTKIYIPAANASSNIFRSVIKMAEMLGKGRGLHHSETTTTRKGNTTHTIKTSR